MGVSITSKYPGMPIPAQFSRVISVSSGFPFPHARIRFALSFLVISSAICFFGGGGIVYMV